MRLKHMLLLSLALLSGCQSVQSFQQAPLLRAAAASRTRDPLAQIQQFHRELQARNPELIRLKYAAMAESPFAFYRATTFLFYQDLPTVSFLNSPVRIWIQGDFHLENLGTWRTARGRYSYDLNDFDEAVQAPYSWELARQAVSIQLAASETGFSRSEREALVRHFLERYVYHLTQLTRTPVVLSQPLDPRLLSEKPAKQVADAAQFERTEYLSENVRNGRFLSGDSRQPVTPAIRREVESALAAYARTRPEGQAFFTPKDIASRIAGKGSLGRYRYNALIEGPSAAPNDDLILELKEAAPAAAEAVLGSRSEPAARIVQAYRYFLPEADPWLGVTRLHGQPAYVRELLPKESVNLAKVNKKGEYEAFLDSVALIGARAHARSGQGARILAEASQRLNELAAWSESYAQIVASDQALFRKALQARRL